MSAVLSLVRLRLISVVRRQTPLLAPAGALLIMLMFGALNSPLADVATAGVVLLFPALAYQARIAVDLEPLAHTDLTTLAIGSAGRRAAADIVAGLLAAGPFVLAAYLIAILGGLLHGGVRPAGIAYAAIALAACAVTAVSIGLCCSRAGAAGAIGLLAAIVLTFVIDSRHGPITWLAPPVIGSLRLLNGQETWPAVAVRAVLWPAAPLALYLRRSQRLG